MTLSLTVLGSSGSYASADEPCSGYLVRSDTTSLWVDCGPGTLGAIQRHLALSDVDAVLVSHQHPDHCAELPVLYNALKWYLRSGPVDVWAAESVRTVTDVHLATSDDLFRWHHFTDGGQFRVGDIAVTTEITDHSVETFAMRFECGDASLVYTADTGNDWDLAAFASAADLLLGEGTVLHAELDAMAPGDRFPHLSVRQLARSAERAGVSTLVVTHLAPGASHAEHAAEARANTGANVIVAHSGLVVEVA